MNNNNLFYDKTTKSIMKVKKIGDRIISIPVFDILNSKAKVINAEEFINSYERYNNTNNVIK